MRHLEARRGFILAKNFHFVTPMAFPRIGRCLIEKKLATRMQAYTALPESGNAKRIRCIEAGAVNAEVGAPIPSDQHTSRHHAYRLHVRHEGKDTRLLFYQRDNSQIVRSPGHNLLFDIRRYKASAIARPRSPVFAVPPMSRVNGACAGPASSTFSIALTMAAPASG